MATYEITSPDGQRFEITAPDDATEAQVLAYAQQQFGQQQAARQERIAKQEAADRELYSPVAGMSWGDKFLAGVGKSFKDTGDGIGQLVDAAGRFMSPYAGMAPAAVADSSKFGPSEAEVSERRRLDDPLMGTGAGLTGNIAGTVAQSFALPGGAAIGGAKLAPALAAGAAQGAALSGLQAVGTDESRLENTLKGGLWGAGGTGLARGLGRVLDPFGVKAGQRLEQEMAKQAAQKAGLSADEIVASTAQGIPARRAAAAELLKKYGIDTTIGQRSGAKPIQTLESVLAEMPSTAGEAAARRGAQQAGFNRQLAEFLGEKGDEITESTLDSVFSRGNKLYNEVGKSTTVKIGDEALNGIEQVWQEASLSLGTESKALFQQAIDRLLEANQKGGMPGDEFLKIRSQLSKASTSSDAPFASAMRGLREVLDDALETSAGQKTAEALQKARQQMRLAIILRDSGAVSEGAASIRKTANAVERANIKGKMPQAVKEFTRAAKEILPDYAANTSNTAAHTAMRNMLTGAGTPGAVGLGTGLITGNPVAGLLAAGAYYGGPKAAQALLQTGPGSRWATGSLGLALTDAKQELLMRSLGLLPLAAAQADQ